MSLLASLGVPYPVVQAPMAGITDAGFVVASCEAGLLGSLGAGMMQPEAIDRAVRKIRTDSSHPFNVNLFVLDEAAPVKIDGEAWRALVVRYRECGLEPPVLPTRCAPSFRDQLAVVEALAPPVVSFTFGIIDAMAVKRLRQRGCLVVGTATHLAEVEAWEQAGADAICLQGAEAGGHRGTFIGAAENALQGSLALLQSARAHTRLPLFAAGGIMDGAGIAAVQCLGAEAAQIGTALLFADEAPISRGYRHQLQRADGQKTRLTRAFSGRLARGIENHFIQVMEGVATFPYPVQNALTQPLRQWAAANDEDGFLSLWAGQGVSAGRCMPIQALAHAWEQERLRAMADTWRPSQVSARFARGGSASQPC